MTKPTRITHHTNIETCKNVSILTDISDHLPIAHVPDTNFFTKKHVQDSEMYIT